MHHKFNNYILIFSIDFLRGEKIYHLTEKGVLYLMNRLSLPYLWKRISMESTHVNEISNDLKNILLDYQNRHPHLSLPQIAKRMCVSHSTLEKIINGESHLEISEMANILIYSGSRDKLADYLKRTNPDFVNAFEKSLTPQHEVPFLEEDSGEYFTKKEYLLILIQAYTRKGTSYKEIKDRYGKEGEDRLKELLEKRILKMEEGRILGVEKKATYSQVKLHKTLQLLMENYDPSLFGQDKNWLSLQTESVDKKKATVAVRKVLRRAYDDIRDILYGEDYKGTDVFFIGMVFDQINKSE